MDERLVQTHFWRPTHWLRWVSWTGKVVVVFFEGGMWMLSVAMKMNIYRQVAREGIVLPAVTHGVFKLLSIAPSQLRQLICIRELGVSLPLKQRGFHEPSYSVSKIGVARKGNAQPLLISVILVAVFKRLKDLLAGWVAR
jgi:hypothetical protein